jgi:hypothetical protein
MIVFRDAVDTNIYSLAFGNAAGAKHIQEWVWYQMQPKGCINY